jgi:uncharacterized DUF497 family protein
MQIDFDPNKNEKNIRERGLSFDRVGDFDFANAAIHKDVRKDYSEARFVALGFLDDRLHVLCFTPTAEGIRVISFRKANRREERNYEQASTND